MPLRLLMAARAEQEGLVFVVPIGWRDVAPSEVMHFATGWNEGQGPLHHDPAEPALAAVTLPDALPKLHELPAILSLDRRLLLKA